MSDKNRNKYLPNILPDVVVSGISNYNGDITIETAKKWLEDNH